MPLSAAQMNGPDSAKASAIQQRIAGARYGSGQRVIEPRSDRPATTDPKKHSAPMPSAQ